MFLPYWRRAGWRRFCQMRNCPAMLTNSLPPLCFLFNSSSQVTVHRCSISLSLSPSLSMPLSLFLSLSPCPSVLSTLKHTPSWNTHAHLKPAQLSAWVSKCCNHVIWWDLFFFFPAKSTSRLLASELMWTWEVSGFPNCQYIPFLSASVLF